MVLLFFMSGILATRADDLFKIRIENDNLIVCVEQQIPDDLEFLELRLKGGKKIHITPVQNDSCKSMFYLNSKQAKQVKNRGIKSIIFHGSISHHKISVDEDQNRQIISNLP